MLWVAADDPDHVAALHLPDVSQNRYRVDPPTDVSAVEQAYVDGGGRPSAIVMPTYR